MTLKDQIEKLSNSIKELEDQSANLQADAYALRQEREVLIAQLILNDKLLSDTQWELKVSTGSDAAHLEFMDGGKGGSMTLIEELARRDYHSWFDLADGVQLRFDDNDIALHFKESKQVLPFVKKQNIKLIGNGVSDQLSKLKRQVAALEVIVHQFGL